MTQQLFPTVRQPDAVGRASQEVLLAQVRYDVGVLLVRRSAIGVAEIKNRLNVATSGLLDSGTQETQNLLQIRIGLQPLSP